MTSSCGNPPHSNHCDSAGRTAGRCFAPNRLRVWVPFCCWQTLRQSGISWWSRLRVTGYRVNNRTSAVQQPARVQAARIRIDRSLCWSSFIGWSRLRVTGAPGSCQVPGFTSLRSDQSEGCSDSPATVGCAGCHYRVDQVASPVRPGSDDDLVIGASDSRTLWQ